MTTERKTQLSLMLLAVVGTIGLLGFFFRTMHKELALYQKAPVVQDSSQTNSAEAFASATDTDNSGSVLGASDNAGANPLQGIYVNPFPRDSNSGSTAQNQSTQGEGVVLSALQPKPTAPIQMYTRGYVYPIAELYNCNSQGACFNFCEQLGNMPLCALFSQKQGFMKPEMVAVTQRLAVGLLSDSNFSNCGTASSCVKLCDQQSNSDNCATLANNYQLASRILGATDGVTANGDVSTITPSGNVSLANPYANINMNYSNPALNKYITSVTGPGCAPLDMLCSSKQQSNPRVLNAAAPSLEMPIDGGGGGGTDGGGGTGVPDSTNPTDPVSLNQCLTNATGGIANQDPSLVLPTQIDGAKTGVTDCQQSYNQNAVSNAESQKQNTFGDITKFQNCINGSKNIAADITRCINLDLR